MNSTFDYKQILYWLIYVAVQVLVLNGIDYLQMATPFLYVLFLINLPTDVNRITLLLIAFATGLVIDAFSSTAGIHSFACVLIAYFKPTFCKAFGPSDSSAIKPSFRSFGRTHYLQFAFVMVAIHHLVFYFMENGSLNLMLRVLIKSGESILFTMILIFSVEYFKYRHSIAE